MYLFKPKADGITWLIPGQISDSTADFQSQTQDNRLIEQLGIFCVYTVSLQNFWSRH